MFRNLANHVMQSRQHAIRVALLFTIVPFFAWIGVTIMALVTLRRGAKEGFYLLLWISLPGTVVGVLGNHQMFLDSVVYGGLFTWLMACLLRETMSWAIVLEVAALMGIAVVFGVHFVAGDLHQYWLNILSANLAEFKQYLIVPVAQANLKMMVNIAAYLATGAQAAAILITGLVNLALARALQARLYNPDGFRREMLQLRLDPLALLTVASLVVLALLGVVSAIDALMLGFLPFVVAGICLVHRSLDNSSQAWLFLSGFYGLLILFAPYVLGALILSAIADTIIRGRRDGRYIIRKNP